MRKNLVNHSVKKLLMVLGNMKASVKETESSKDRSLLKVGQSMKASGLMGKGMVKVNKSGWMDHATRVNGRMGKLMAMESFIMQMVTFMKETGSMTRLTEMGHIRMQTALSMLVSGKTISSMVSDWRPGQMAQSTKVHISRGKRMEKVN